MTIRKALPSENHPATVSIHRPACGCARDRTDPGCIALRELIALDAEITVARGWVRAVYRSAIAWEPPRSSPDYLGAPWKGTDGVGIYRRCDGPPPPWSSSWAFAGPLLLEIPGAALVPGAWGWFVGDVRRLDMNRCHATPQESIARAWLAWKRAQAAAQASA